MKKAVFILGAMGLASCGHNENNANRTNADNTTTVANDSIDAAPASQNETVALLDRGDAKACATDGVKDALISAAMPRKPEQLSETEWEDATSKDTATFNNIASTSVNKDAKFVECTATMMVPMKFNDSTFSGPITYKVSIDLSNDASFLVYPNFGSAGKMFSSNVISDAAKQVEADEKADGTYNDPNITRDAGGYGAQHNAQ